MNAKVFTRGLWISFGGIAISIVVAVGAIYYLAGDLSAQADAIARVRAQVQDETVAVGNLASLKAQAPQAEQYQTAIDGLIPGQYGLVTFSQWFQDMGKQYGVTAAASFQGAVTPAQGTVPGTVVFSFNASGPPSNVETFLDAVSRRATGFLLSIDSFNVSMNGTDYQVAGRGTLFSQ